MAPQIVESAAQQPAVAQVLDQSQQAYAQPYQQPQVVQTPPPASAPSYTVVEPTPEERQKVQLYLDNGYKDVAMVVDASGQRLLRSRAPLDTEPTYKVL